MKRIILTLTIVSCLFGLFGCNEAENYETKIEDTSRSVLVYVTNSGECYHESSCQYLSKSSIEMELEEAIEDGYRPCSRCDPPTED